MSRQSAVFVRLLLLVAANIAGFVFLQHLARMGETRLSAEVAGLVGRGRIQVVGDGTQVLVAPWHQPVFLAIVTSSCSSISSVCSITCLAGLIPSVTVRRRVLSLGTALTVVVLGNVLRIASSLVMGLGAGRVALVLFHDWVGSIFAFAYTLGGFILLLYLVLPSSTPRTRTLHAVAH